LLIIIEGCDLTGKTTLAGLLAEEIPGARIAHAGPPTDHPLVSYELSIRDYAPMTGDHVILDRFHLGEMVWPAVFDRESQLDVPTATHIEMFLRSRGAWVVYAERDRAKLQAAIAAVDPPEPITAAQVPQVLHLFEKAVNFSGQSVSSWDFERDDEDTILGIIANAYARESKVGPIWEYTSEWIGVPDPDVLFVGDVRRCGHYLMSCLPEGLWRKCAIVNAYVGRSKETQPLDELWEAFGCPIVIALGAQAHQVLVSYGVPHTDVEHPQFRRRFHHHDRASYTQRLMIAAGS
jgi:hypothetical protein